MLESIKEIIAQQLRADINEITEDTNIVDDLGADSLDIVEILMTIEQKHGITVPDEEVANFKTVGDIAKYLDDNQ